MSDVKLLPCPFCGKAPVVAKTGGIELRCASCAMGPNTGHYSDPSAAIALWNTRPAPALTPKQEAADEMFDALDCTIRAARAMRNALIEAGGDDMRTVDAILASADAALAKAGQRSDHAPTKTLTTVTIEDFDSGFVARYEPGGLVASDPSAANALRKLASMLERMADFAAKAGRP